MSTVDGAVRRLAAVWFADIVGYTRLSAEDENAALRLVTILQQAAGEAISAHGGRLVKVIGDAVLAEFNSSDAAVRAALGLQHAFASAAAAEGLSGRLRIGVHVGDVVSTADGDLYGDGINTASRVQGQAQPGQVLVTQDIWHQLRQRKDFRFDSVGERDLKGLAGRVWLFGARLARPGEEKATTVLPRRPPGRYARLARVALTYVVVSAIVLQGTELLRHRLQLPDWVTPIGFVLLLAGLMVIVATAWVQSRPAWERRVGEEADPWRVDVGDLATSVARRRLPELTWARALLGGVLAFSILFGAAGSYVLVRERSPPALITRPAFAQPGPGLAILPFQASGVESELWGEGMVDLLAINLDGAGGIRVIDPRSVLSRLREGSEIADSAAAIRLAGGVGARYAVTGRVLATPQRLTITAEVLDAETGEVLGRPTVDGPPDSFPQLVDRIGLEILRAGITPAAGEQLRPLDLTRLATTSPTALRAYLAGTQEFRRSRWREAQSAFRRAIQADSTFALAAYRMSLATSWSEQPHVPRRNGFGEAAMRFADRLPERDALLVEGNAQLNRRPAEAIGTLERLTSRYPDDVEGWFLLGDAYYHLEPQDRRFRDALQEALRLDPTFGPAYLHLIEDAVERDDTAGARQLIARYRAVDPGSPLLSSLVLLLGRDRSEPGPPAAAPAPADPARSAFESAREAADAARSVAATAGVTGSQPTFARADSLRREALGAAEAGRYAAAQRQMDAAKLEYDNARAQAVWTARLDSARLALEPLRTQAGSAPGAAEADALVGSAAEAEAAGRYQEALAHLREAAERYRRAAEVAARPPDPPPAPEEPAAGAAAADIAADVLEQLRRAIESKDPGRLRAVWVTLTPAETRNFEASFAIMRDLDVAFDVLAVEAVGDEISVTARTTYEFFNETTRRADRQVFTQVLQLARRGDRWVVVGSRT